MPATATRFRALHHLKRFTSARSPGPRPEVQAEQGPFSSGHDASHHHSGLLQPSVDCPRPTLILIASKGDRGGSADLPCCCAALEGFYRGGCEGEHLAAGLAGSLSRALKLNDVVADDHGERMVAEDGFAGTGDVRM